MQKFIYEYFYGSEFEGYTKYIPFETDKDKETLITELGLKALEYHKKCQEIFKQVDNYDLKMKNASKKNDMTLYKEIYNQKNALLDDLKYVEFNGVKYASDVFDSLLSDNGNVMVDYITFYTLDEWFEAQKRAYTKAL